MTDISPTSHHDQPLQILLAEDSPSDAGLTLEALRRSSAPNTAHHVEDGIELLAFLRRQGQHTNAPMPDLILLDLNMPRMDGREVLTELLRDESLRHIPVIVLTTSNSDDDVIAAYQRKASCYIRKPVSLSAFMQAMKKIDEFWFQLVKLPRGEQQFV
jgi:chemotaxis family two-component system response regulator Rcp1